MDRTPEDGDEDVDHFSPQMLALITRISSRVKRSVQKVKNAQRGTTCPRRQSAHIPE